MDVLLVRLLILAHFIAIHECDHSQVVFEVFQNEEQFVLNRGQFRKVHFSVDQRFVAILRFILSNGYWFFHLLLFCFLQLLLFEWRFALLWLVRWLVDIIDFEMQRLAEYWKQVFLLP